MFRARRLPWRRALDRLPETPAPLESVPEGALRWRTRRDFLLFGAGVAASTLGFWWLMPDGAFEGDLPAGAIAALDRASARFGLSRKRREGVLNGGLTFDDDVAEALYSPTRSVRTYAKSQITALRNNYNGATPGAGYLADWRLSVDGLASGRTESFSIDDLLRRFPLHEQITRLVCVEGWSAVAWWKGIRFADFLEAFPPMRKARWAALESGVNLDSQGNEDPYYVSLDLSTARHPQALLATHWNGAPLTVAHGAPLRLLVPMKLGLKNIKAITEITYSTDQPDDYWAKRGYSKYDGL